MITFKGKTLINRGEDFKQGCFEGVNLNDENEIVLDDSKLRGDYISPEINTNKFYNLVSSWNVVTPRGTYVEIFFKVRVDGNWSKWLSYGKWSSNEIRESFKDQKDEIARMDIDTLIVLNNKEGDRLKYKVNLVRNDNVLESPKVEAIYSALKLTDEKILDELNIYNDWTGELDVPKRSQMVVPEIGNIICSPTSLSMVLEYYGEKLDTEVVAENVLDKGTNLYGNWSYNVAYAGSLGFNAYVDRFTSVNEVKEKLSKRIPVIASIMIKSKEDLEGAPTAYPGGHLLVIIGFKNKNNEEYVIVNDPAAPSHETVRREYKLSEFMKAWRKIVYILLSNSK